MKYRYPEPCSNVETDEHNASASISYGIFLLPLVTVTNGSGGGPFHIRVGKGVILSLYPAGTLCIVLVNLILTSKS